MRLKGILYRTINSFNRRALVLMYHRIGISSTDPWNLSVSPENFEQQVLVLKKNYNVLPLNEFFKRQHGTRKSILITFDDAYSNNFYHAKPILEKYECAATFFVPSAFIGTGKYFWWDELENIILNADSLPVYFSQTINGKAINFNIDAECLSDEQRILQQQWRWPDDPPGKRCELYLKIWEVLRSLPYEEIDIALKKIKEWAKYDSPTDPENIPMNEAQLKELVSHPLFTVNIHTDTHPALSLHHPDYQEMEIKKCRQYLENNLKAKADVIAYPYGDFNDVTIAAAKKAGLKAGFTTNPEWVTRKSNPFKLGRYQVLDWNGDEFEKQISNWYRNG